MLSEAPDSELGNRLERVIQSSWGLGFLNVSKDPGVFLVHLLSPESQVHLAHSRWSLMPEQWIGRWMNG